MIRDYNCSCIRYAYCDSALKSVIDYFERNEIDIVLYYDIACQYQVNIKHLKVSLELLVHLSINYSQRLPDLDRNRVKFAVPTFHLYAHK